jgi:hypothetical protein
MMRKFITISVLALAITLIVAFSWTNLKKTGFVRNLIAHVIQPKPVGIPIPPPLEALGQGARLPTEQELEQEKKYNAQQEKLAGQWLKSSNAHQRIIGAEQLSAYESPVSEQYLVHVLLHDAVPEVRKTAAQSLSSFKNLSDHTVSALLEALSDANKSTRIATLNTLLSYAFLINTDTKKPGQLVARLRKKLRSGHLNKDVRDSLQAFIKDQEPPTNAFFFSVTFPNSQN